MLLVQLHLGMWHPRLEACPRCERHEEGTTRYKCPCHTRIAEGRRGSVSAMQPPRGMSLRIINGVPRPHTCIAAEGEGTPDWAAVPADHVHVQVAMHKVPFRQWATIVHFFATNT